MGRVRKLGGDAIWLLRERNILGRSRASTIRLEGHEVSGEHAVLRWTGSHWQIQDLHSRNGVYLDGRRLRIDERAGLEAGAVIGLGRPDGYILADADPPVAFAARIADPAEPVVAHGGLLALPGPLDPEAMIFRDVRGWCLEQAGETRVVSDDEVVRVGRDDWRLTLPELLAPTADSASVAPRIDDLRLRFSVSRDEEYVELLAFHGARTFDFKARSHHYPLLLLARLRLQQPQRPPEHQGWIDQDELLQMLQTDRNQLHLNIFRLRRQFDEAGIADAPRIVERRTGTRQLRIGVAYVEVVPLAGDHAVG